MVLSLIAGAGAARLLRNFLRRVKKAAAWQRWAAGGMAFLHGAQDGQKFMALLLMTSGSSTASSLPWLLLTAGVMALGTALGGRPIVEKVGTELAHLTPEDGLSADLGAGAVNF